MLERESRPAFAVRVGRRQTRRPRVQTRGHHRQISPVSSASRRGSSMRSRTGRLASQCRTSSTWVNASTLCCCDVCGSATEYFHTVILLAAGAGGDDGRAAHPPAIRLIIARTTGPGFDTSRHLLRSPLRCNVECLAGTAANSQVGTNQNLFG
jgi:hypothetical protein